MKTKSYRCAFGTFDMLLLVNAISPGGAGTGALPCTQKSG